MNVRLRSLASTGGALLVATGCATSGLNQQKSSALGHAARGDLASAEVGFRAVAELERTHAWVAGELSLRVVEDVARGQISPTGALHILRGISHWDRRKGRAAFAEYQAAMALEPDYALLHALQGVWRFEQRGPPNETESLEEAIRSLDRALELEPTLVFAYVTRGSSYSELGRSELALADHDRAAELDPTSGLVYYNRGYVKGKFDDFDGAIADLHLAMQYSPRLTEAHEFLALAYYMKCDFDGALLVVDAAEAQGHRIRNPRLGKRTLSEYAQGPLAGYRIPRRCAVHTPG
jgi:tetratricopeptide (TPR) repeat protein